MSGEPAVITVVPTPTVTLPAHEAGYVSIPWGGGFDAIFVPTPTPAEDVPVLPVEAPVYYATSTVEFDFQRGWADGGGLLYKQPASVSRWVHCESTWAVVTAGNYLSLTQFLPSTWGHVAAITGYWNVYDPYQHGYNAAVWALMSDPAQQWPVCFWR